MAVRLFSRLHIDIFVTGSIIGNTTVTCHKKIGLKSARNHNGQFFKCNIAVFIRNELSMHAT